MIKLSDLEGLDNSLTVKEIKDIIKREYPYICPKCKGKGKIYVPDCFGDGRTGNYYIPCKLCNGYGRTKEEKKPIYKIIGYE